MMGNRLCVDFISRALSLISPDPGIVLDGWLMLRGASESDRGPQSGEADGWYRTIEF